MKERCGFNSEMLLVVAVMMAVLQLGCSTANHSASFDVKGKVTFDGEPIPVGFIQLIPTGGKGVQGFARIEDGVYDTAGGGQCRGIEPGEHLVKVVGYDGIAYEDDENEVNGNGTLLFPQYQIKKSFEAENTSFDINVPRT